MSTRIVPPPAAPSAGKHITRDRATGDYAAYYDGRYLGSAATAHEAYAIADQYVFDYFTHGGTAGALAAGAE